MKKFEQLDKQEQSIKNARKKKENSTVTITPKAIIIFLFILAAIGCGIFFLFRDSSNNKPTLADIQAANSFGKNAGSNSSLGPEYTNALNSANRLLKSSPYSLAKLIEKLTERGYTSDAAQYAAENCGANWNEQAQKKANQLINKESYTYETLISALETEYGFTHDQAEFGATNTDGQIYAESPASDFDYVSNGETVQINGYKGTGGIIRIPDTIEGLPVTRIAGNAFYENNSITGVVFPSKLSFIGSDAFCCCSNLKGVLILPSELQTIEGMAFQGCNNVTGVIIQSDCTVEGNGFYCMFGLESIMVVENCNVRIERLNVNSEVFTELVVPDSVDIDNEAFQTTNKLTIYTPAGSPAEEFAKKNNIKVNTADYESKKNEYMQQHALSPVPPPTPVPSPEEIAESPASDFIYENDGEAVQINGYKGSGGIIRIPDSIEGLPVTRVAESAFMNDIGIRSIVFPAKLAFIGRSAFSGCDNLKGVLIFPTELQTIEGQAFWGCHRITGFIIQSDCTVEGNGFYNMDGLKYIMVTDGCHATIENYNVNSSVFSELVVPDSVYIENEAFQTTNKLTIYTPAGSPAEKYAKSNYIIVNTADYESKKAEYMQRYGLSSVTTPVNTSTPAPTNTPQSQVKTPEYDNAVQSAKRIIKSNPISRDSLVKKLMDHGYSNQAAEYAADNCNADWKEQALKKAKKLISSDSCSDDDLIKQLESEGFTHEEALYAVDNH